MTTDPTHGLSSMGSTFAERMAARVAAEQGPAEAKQVDDAGDGVEDKAVVAKKATTKRTRRTEA